MQRPPLRTVYVIPGNVLVLLAFCERRDSWNLWKYGRISCKYWPMLKQNAEWLGQMDSNLT